MVRTADELERDLQDDLSALDAAYRAAATDARAASREGVDSGALWRTCKSLYSMASRVRMRLLLESWEAE
jgi:hypothetical protein